MLRVRSLSQCHWCLASTSSALQIESRRSIFYWRTFRRWQDGVKEIKAFDQEKRVTRIYLDGGYIEAENPKAVINKPLEEQTREESGSFSTDFMAKHWMVRTLDWSAPTRRRYYEYEQLIKRQYDQRFIAERHLYLGPDLAAAHFLVHRGAAVKFVGDDTWYKRDALGRYSLPGVRVPGMHLEAIDASGTQLMWEAFDNMADLEHLRLLRLADCPYVDDWCMSKMSQFAGTLELLDLTNCARVSAYGLSALAPLKRLRRLRIGGVATGEAQIAGRGQFAASKDVAKVALMLEQAIPGLSVSDVDYDAALVELAREHRLAESERVVEDARGNLFAADDNGHLYCVGGRVDRLERSVVDQFDQPYIMSRIRRDVPDMPLRDLITLDKLCRQRIKALLIGSPSSVHWSDDIERVIGFHDDYAHAHGAATDTFMLPVDRLRDRLLDDGNMEALAALDTDVDRQLELDVRRRLDMGVEERMIEEAKRIAMGDRPANKEEEESVKLARQA